MIQRHWQHIVRLAQGLVNILINMTIFPGTNKIIRRRKDVEISRPPFCKPCLIFNCFIVTCIGRMKVCIAESIQQLIY